MEKKTILDIINQLKKMTIIEINDLVQAIEKEFSVSANINLQAGSKKEKQDTVEVSEVSVFLKEIGPKKVEIIKKIREIKNLGLMEAKKLVDQAPILIEEKVKPEKANELKKILEEIGAVVEIK